MKNILIYTTKYPFPVDGGDSLRIINIAELLSKYYNVVIVCNSNAEQSVNLIEFKYKDIKVCSFKKEPIIHKFFNVLNSIFFGKTLQHGFFRNRNLNSWIIENQHRFDFLYFHLLRSYDVNDLVDINKVIIDLTDCLTMAYRKIPFSFIDFKKIFFFCDRFFVRRYEIFLSSINCKRIFVSENDLNYFLKISNTSNLNNLIIKQSTNNVKIYPLRLPKNNILRLCFIGNMTTLPNKDAINYLLNYIKSLDKTNFDLKLKIIGKVDEKQKIKWEKNKFVKCAGFVDDLDSELETVDIGIATMRLGSGMQNKVLDFLDRNIPIFGTELSFAGFEGFDFNNLIIDMDSNFNIFDKIYNDNSFFEEAYSTCSLYRAYSTNRDDSIVPLTKIIGI